MKKRPCFQAAVMLVILTVSPPGDWTVNSALPTFAPDPGPATSKVIFRTGTMKKFIRAVAVKPLP